MKKLRKAVLPVAGFGTRFLPATKATPKEMLPIIDKPLVQYAVEEAIKIGIEEDDDEYAGPSSLQYDAFHDGGRGD